MQKNLRTLRGLPNVDLLKFYVTTFPERVCDPMRLVSDGGECDGFGGPCGTLFSAAEVCSEISYAL